MKVGELVKKNQREIRKLRQYDNVIIFPGTYEKLVRDGEKYLSEDQYEKAIQAFDGAIQLEPASTEFLFSFALALYETKAYPRAKQYALAALETGTGNYILVMELYLTVLIHLEEYEEVEISTQALLEEGLVPSEMLSKIIYLRDLNRRLSNRYSDEAPIEEKPAFTFEAFKAKDLYFQQQYLTSLKGNELERSIGLLEEIVESTTIPPSLITFALMLLKEIQYDLPVTVQKYGQKLKVSPSEIALPGHDEQSQAVLQAIESKLAKDPSKLHFVESAIRKFVINAFPFNWGDYSADVIADAYIAYIDDLMTGEALADNPLFSFIQQVDREADF